MPWVPIGQAAYRASFSASTSNPDVQIALEDSRVTYEATSRDNGAAAYSLRVAKNHYPGRPVICRVTVEAYEAADSADKEGLWYSPGYFIVQDNADLPVAFLQHNQAAPYVDGAADLVMPSADPVMEWLPAQVLIDTPMQFFQYQGSYTGEARTVADESDTAWSHLVEVWVDSDIAAEAGSSAGTVYGAGAAGVNAAIAWPFATGGEYSEQLDWATDVIPVASGGSQHRRLRQSPRVTLALSALLEGPPRRRMEALLRANSAGRWWVPVWIDSVALAAPASAAATVLAVDVGDARFADGGRALLWNGDPLSAVVVSIAPGGVGASSLTLAAGLVAGVPVGAQVVPLRLGRLAEFPQVGRFTADASDVVDLSFRLDETLDDAAVVAGDTYRGYPVWPFRPDWSGAPAWSPERVLQSVDDGIGPPLVHDLAAVPQGRTAMDYLLMTPADVVAFRRALFALAGRWSPAWVPSWNGDARVVAAVANGATSIDIQAPCFAGLPLPANQRDLRIELRNGTVLYRRITDVTTPSAGVERMALDAPIATGFASADVLLISLMTLCVQDADTNLLRYWTREVMECGLVWRQVAHGL